MPVSKKPRAKTTAKAPPLPDRRAMEVQKSRLSLTDGVG
jgi:hypothetical protein